MHPFAKPQRPKGCWGRCQLRRISPGPPSALLAPAHARRTVAGVTLMELMVTLSVAAILAVLVVPGFTALIRGNRSATLANDALTALTLARSEAVLRGARVSVCASGNPMDSTPTCSGSTNWATGWMVFVDTSTSESTVTVGQVLRVWPGVSGVTLTGTAANVRFGATGEVFNTLTLTLNPSGCEGEEARAIGVNAVGRASVQKVVCS